MKVLHCRIYCQKWLFWLQWLSKSLSPVSSFISEHTIIPICTLYIVQVIDIVATKKWLPRNKMRKSCSKRQKLLQLCFSCFLSPPRSLWLGRREALPRTWFSSVRRVDEKKGQVDQGDRGGQGDQGGYKDKWGSCFRWVWVESQWEIGLKNLRSLHIRLF